MLLVELASPREKAPAGMVGYVFSKDEINTSTWVHKGIVDAGAYSNLDWAELNEKSKNIGNELVIFHATRPVPRAIESVRRTLDPRIKKRLRKILLNMHKDPDAKKALLAYQKTTRFDALTAEIVAGLDSARRLKRLMESAGPSN
jgi:phosphonate transport system substrate-binding protein